MDIEKIVQIFCRLSGIDSEDAVGFRFMCETALSYVMSHIKHDADTRGCGGRINFAAAALAYYRYVLWSLTDGQLNEVKVGDISVKRTGNRELDAADKLCREAFSNISDILENDEFVFKGI